MNLDSESTARTLVAGGKGILAADETPGTLTKRFDALGICSTAESRRAYRELLFTAPDAAASISGVIMQDEAIRQKSSTRIPLAEALASRGIVPGIKVDAGAQPLALGAGASRCRARGVARARRERKAVGGAVAPGPVQRSRQSRPLHGRHGRELGVWVETPCVQRRLTAR